MEEIKRFMREIDDRAYNQIVIKTGIGPLSLLGIAFVIMKCTGAVTWSWWWVLAPFWIPLLVMAGFFILLTILILVAIAASKTMKVEPTIEVKTATPKEDIEKEVVAKKEVTEETPKVETPNKPKRKRKKNGTESKNTPEKEQAS